MPVIVGYCDPIDTIRTFYIGMLLLALERSDNDLKIYNMVKSPIIEDFLSNRKFDNTHCRKRQQPIQQIIKIYPKNDKEFICNENNEYYAISEDETIVEIIDKNGQQLKLNRIVQWAEKYNKLLIETESKNDKFLFDYVAFNEEGLRYAKEIRKLLSPNIDIWYFPISENNSIRETPQLIIEENSR